MNIDREVSIMKKVISKSLKSFMLSFGFLALVGCSANTKPVAEQTTQGPDDKTEIVEVNNNKVELPAGKYNEGIVLIKKADFDKSMLGDLQYESIKQLYKNSPWQKIELKSKDKTSEAVEYLSSLNIFDQVEYDYIMCSDGTIESIDVSGNPNSNEQDYLDAQGIFDGWGYQLANNLTPGGSPDVVVAVIDTGVDYNHVDLRNNIWINSGEIPDNHIDDDGNGYVDDIHGWDCVGNDKDPMDDNGHGTHVAGIIAAENNTIGTVGVAFKCKIMCLKAGNSTGYFNNSDIAEAIQYAYMNGASVINMSFGGASISLAVKDALEAAYNQCVLVAAAGNDCFCNNLNCPIHKPVGQVEECYPASLPYVIGVMSTNSTGTRISSFSNYDHFPYGSIEYEAFACGEQVPSTWPNNKIARLSGTSMASPVVAGTAAVLRSIYTDREVYSNKFIQSQIVNTGLIFPDGYHSFVDLYQAITKLPTPNVGLYDFYIFDNKEYGAKNNGNGIIDAGETIHLALELINRGGVASNVTASIDTIRNNDLSLRDPYITIVNENIDLSNIGTYSIRDCGKIYDGDTVVGTNSYFELNISDDCPNDYFCNINLIVHYENGLDLTDHSNYSYASSCRLSIYNGTPIPDVITEDTVLDSTKEYTVSSDVVIAEGATLTILEGTSIKFYTNSDSYYSYTNDLYIKCYGNLNIQGSAEKHVNLSVNETVGRRYAWITSYGGEINIDYADMLNVTVFKPYDEYITNVSNSSLIYGYTDAVAKISNLTNCYIQAPSYINTFLFYVNVLADSNYFRFGYASCSPFLYFGHATVTNNVFELAKDANRFYSNANANISLEQTILENNVFINEGEYCSGGFVIYNNNQNNTIINNHFLGSFASNEKDIFTEYYSPSGQPNPVINEDYENDEALIRSYIKDISLFDKEGNKTKIIGKEPVTIQITFNRDMNTQSNLSVCYGSKDPFSDYRIDGDFINSKTWEGQFEVKAFIENGNQFFTIRNAVEENGLQCHDMGRRFTFDINTSSSLSMNLQAYSSKEGINLEWVQDDYDTLMGYNVYRSTSKDGNYTKLNNSVIPAGENTFVDENAEPGVTYWYTFTVVFSDMTESAPAGKVSCTAADTIAPSIYHTPVNQGYLNNNLVISCTASDNIGIQSVTLYYRTKGQNEWKSLAMLKQNDRYSATVFGSDLSLEGLEYYIVASDGVNTINKGSAENPYSVIIKDASAISQLGDVDGDGVITTKDALMIMQSINGDLLLTDDQFRRADLNKDNVLSSVEALRILQYINGNVPTLEM